MKKARKWITRSLPLLLLVLAVSISSGKGGVTAAEESSICVGVNGEKCKNEEEEHEGTTGADTNNNNKQEEDKTNNNNLQQHDIKSWFENITSEDSLKFLQQNVFGQKPKKKKKNRPQLERRSQSFSQLFKKSSSSGGGEAINKSGSGADGDDTSTTTGENDNEDQDENSSSSGSILEILKNIFDSEDPDQALLDFLLLKSASHEDAASQTSFEETARLFMDHIKEIMAQLQRVVGDAVDELMQDYFYLPSAWYLLRAEQELKNSFWKTSQHRFYQKTTDIDFFHELHQALYVSNLAYVDTEAELKAGLAKVDEDGWQLLYADMQGNPSEPSHFLAVEKQSAPLNNKNKQKKETGSSSFWRRAARNLQLEDEIYDTSSQEDDDDTIKVMLVVRGTKTVGDVLSDGLLEATTFKGKYKAHGGIASSGQYLVNKHIGRLGNLLEASGRSKIQLLLFGHSLGCGTAAIAAMELHDNYQDIMNVRAVGFGCPSLVSPALSEQYKDIITTVIADADVVPRLSGSSIVNLHLSMMSLDWTDYMWEELTEVGADIIKDVTKWTNGVASKFVTDLLQKLGEFIQEKMVDVKPNIQKARDTAIPAAFPVRKAQNELIPPGECLHLYRTATGFEAAYTPCTFFDEIEYVPHLVDDHLCQSGYHLALLTLLRQGLKDQNAVFENELYP